MALSVATFQMASTMSGGPTLLAPAFNLTAGNSVVIQARIYPPTTTVTSFTDTALNTYTLVNTFSTASNGYGVYYLCSNCLGNATNVVKLTGSTTFSFTGFGVWQIAGGQVVFDVGASAFSGTGSTLTSASFNTAYADSVVLPSGWSNTAANYTPGTGYTQDGIATNLAIWEHKVFTTKQTGITATAGANQNGYTMYTASFGIKPSVTSNQLMMMGCGT